MAFLGSFSFSTLLCSQKSLRFQEVQPRPLEGRRLLSRATRSIRLHNPKWSGKVGFSVKQRSLCFVTVSRNSSHPFSHYFDVCSRAHTVISGFWVGPDIDDGWGFVDAFVYRM